MFARRIDEQDDSLLLGVSQHHPVTNRDDVVLIGVAAVCALIAHVAVAGSDVLALVAHSGRTLANEEPSVLTEIILPRIGVVLGFVEHQRLVVDAAMVGRLFGMHGPGNASGVIAVAPIHERLRIRVSGSSRERKPDFGVDSIVDAAAVAAHAGPRNDLTAAVIGEVR